MKVGAERRKIGILAVLGIAAAYLIYTNVFSSEPGATPQTTHTPAATKAPAQVAAPSAAAAKRGAASASRQAGSRGSSAEFRPPYIPRVAQDLSRIDPKLRLDLLAKVQAVEAAPAERNLFQFGTAPALVAAAGGMNGGPIINPKRQPTAQTAQTPGPPPVPVAPTAPPIALKYYGFVAQRSDGHKRAFFLDGEDILVAAEGETVKRRYKVVRIGVNSVTMEDTQFNSTQTLQLAEEAAG